MTIAYFGLDVKGDGSFDTTTRGWTGWTSQDLVNTINRAHQNGDRVDVVIKQFDEATINQIVTDPATTQTAVTNTINAIAAMQLDGVNVDFEGRSDPNYPNIQGHDELHESAVAAGTCALAHCRGQHRYLHRVGELGRWNLQDW